MNPGSWLRNKVLVGVGGVVLAGALLVGTVAAATTSATFNMVPSATAVTANCLSGASGHGVINSLGPVEAMRVAVKGLPANTNFDVFIIQVPNAPFGISWYLGDLQTDRNGAGNQRFVGRFSIETFAVAPGSAAAPQVFTSLPFPDATNNPAFGPVQTYHVGIWFNNPADAVAAGCPSTVTPFNGTHNAGVQALSTRTFADDQGPLRQIQP